MGVVSCHHHFLHTTPTTSKLNASFLSRATRQRAGCTRSLGYITPPPSRATFIVRKHSCDQPNQQPCRPPLLSPAYSLFSSSLLHLLSFTNVRNSLSLLLLLPRLLAITLLTISVLGTGMKWDEMMSVVSLFFFFFFCLSFYFLDQARKDRFLF